MAESVTAFTEADHVLLRDATRGFLAAAWPLEGARERSADPAAVRALWRRLAAEQGLAALGSGGDAGGLVEAAIVLEELGRALCPAPLPAALLANRALAAARAGSEEVSDLLDAIHAGAIAPAFAFGALDGDRKAGRLEQRDGRLSGRVAFVEAVGATHLLAVVEPGPALAVLPLDAPGVTVTPTPSFGESGFAAVALDQVEAPLLPLAPEAVADLNRLARLALTARALGSATRLFEIAVEHAKTRQQFGQPIGRFQAIQHKLANGLIDLDSTRLTLAHAARTHDADDAHWRPFASAALAFAGTALRRVANEAHHTLAAFGYAEEFEAPGHFRRIHNDVVRMGGVPRAQDELAAHVLAHGPLPAYDLGPAANAFRDEVRGWIAGHWQGAPRAAHAALPYHERHWDRAVSRKLAEKGWIGLSWPKRYGGQERSALERLAYVEEMTFADVPVAGHNGAATLIGPSLIAHGTEAQKAAILPRILRAEITFCLGYSESESGSDLASLRTRATKVEGGWIVNGQKLWTTYGDKSEYVFLAVRTDPEAKPKHAGISLFLVPMDSPGITIRPSMAMYGGTFCTVFYDDVFVPDEAVLGEVNGGWKILTGALADERITIGSFVARLRGTFGELAEHVRDATAADGAPLAEDAQIRRQLGALAADIEAGRQLMMRSIQMIERGVTPYHEAAMTKVFSSELMQRLSETALDLLGAEAALSHGAEGAPLAGTLEQTLRQSIMIIVGGGTNEIQRTLIAQRGLGLPR